MTLGAEMFLVPTAELDLVIDTSFDEALKYKDESGQIAGALRDKRQVLRGLAVKLPGTARLMKNKIGFKFLIHNFAFFKNSPTKIS